MPFDILTLWHINIIITVHNDMNDRKELAFIMAMVHKTSFLELSKWGRTCYALNEIL